MGERGAAAPRAGYQPAWLDALSRRQLVWVGAGLDRVAVYFREDAPCAGPHLEHLRPRPGRKQAIRAALGRGAMFWADLLAETGPRRRPRSPRSGARLGGGGHERRLDAAPRRPALPGASRPEAPRRFSRTRGAGVTSTQGRWATADRLFPGTPDRRALAELLLERQGIVTRDGVRGRGHSRRLWGRLLGAEGSRDDRRLQAATSSRSRRPVRPRGAVERLRELRSEEEPEALVLAAADPAQPYGAALPWPKRAGARAARVAGAQVVLLGGEAALYVERGGRTCALREPDEDWLRPAIAALVEYVRTGGAKRLAVERFDGRPVIETEIVPLLVEAGFLAGPARSCWPRAGGEGRRPPRRAARRGAGTADEDAELLREPLLVEPVGDEVIDSTDAALRQSSSAPSRVASVQDDSSGASAPRYTASQPSACGSTASAAGRPRARPGAHACGGSGGLRGGRRAAAAWPARLR